MQAIHEKIAQLTSAFYSAFTNSGGAAPVDVLYEICIPEALIVNATEGIPAIYNLRDFVEPRRKLLDGGMLTNFKECEVSGQTEVCGRLAHRTSRYEKTWTDRGSQQRGSGTKLLSFVQMPQGWKIASVLWYDDPTF